LKLSESTSNGRKKAGESMMRKSLSVLFLVLVVVTVPLLAQRDTNSTRVVDQIIAERKLDGFILRKSSIDTEDIPLLELFFSASAMKQLRGNFPITTWQSLHDIFYKYLSLRDITTCLEPRVLILRLLFDLQGDWPWKGEWATGCESVEAVSSSIRTVDQIIAERGVDRFILRKSSIDTEDIPLLELFFSASAMNQLRENFPITTWQTLHDLKYRPCPALHDTPPIRVCSKLQAIMLRFLFDLEGNWPCTISVILKDIRLGYNNAVGCEWSFFLMIDGEKILVYRHVGSRMVYNKSFEDSTELKVTATAVELDNWDDRGSSSASFHLCCPPHEVVQRQVLEVRVYEYHGPGQGYGQNTALWQFEVWVEVK
jgi:hypothetical protein